MALVGVETGQGARFLQAQFISSYTFAAVLSYPDSIGKTRIFWRGPWITIDRLIALAGKTSLF